MIYFYGVTVVMYDIASDVKFHEIVLVFKLKISSHISRYSLVVYQNDIKLNKLIVCSFDMKIINLRCKNQK